MDYDSTLLEAVFNHITLPVKLPGGQDHRLNDISQALVQRLISSSRLMRDLANKSVDYARWDVARISLQSCKTLCEGGRLNTASLATAFHERGRQHTLILYFAPQNAGLLICPHSDESGEGVLFEAFEASPLSAEVLASRKALDWSFPGSAAVVPLSRFNNPSFQNELAKFLEQASIESVKRFGAHIIKAGASTFESRDTADPAIITSLLMTLLQCQGTHVSTPLLRKRVRDDVCWSPGAELPWRRSPFWLVLRVGIRRHLETVFGVGAGRVQYKFLVCVMLARLLSDSLGQLEAEQLSLLNAKLCRRIFKLESEQKEATPDIQLIYTNLFSQLQPTFDKSVQDCALRMADLWRMFKERSCRKTDDLPYYIQPHQLILSLPNSGPHLKAILKNSQYQTLAPSTVSGFKPPKGYSLSQGPTASVGFTSRYFKLARLELAIEKACSEVFPPTNPPDRGELEKYCLSYARQIYVYLELSQYAYESNPEQKSVMILTLLELWMSMDRCAVEVFGLLKDFAPGFTPFILDVLQLSRHHDMVRAQNIRAYLGERNSVAKTITTTIFSDPARGCFGERYYDESESASDLHELHKEIEDDAEKMRQEKEQEWRATSAEYEALVRRVSLSSCLYFTSDDADQTQHHNSRQCLKCATQAKVDRFRRIGVYEHPLPANEIHAKVVVFELRIPKVFAEYREATWRIISSLALPDATPGRNPTIFLHDYARLNAYTNTNAQRQFSLASIPKSFLEAHYRSSGFPVEWESICKPNGLKLRYYDNFSKTWPGQISYPTFHATFRHHCQLIVPPKSPYGSFSSRLVKGGGPSSYQAIASQAECPSGINLHEFVAYQTLLSGDARRWPQILVELGASNLNFSSEAAAFQMSYLSSQLGPAYKDDPLGVIHEHLKDEIFCRRLLGQLEKRLQGLSTNWREVNAMEIILTLTLRLSSLSENFHCETHNLLIKARTVINTWTSQLRAELQSTTDAETTRKLSRYILWAALLCRRTFAAADEQGENLDAESVQSFIESSIIQQDNLSGDPASLPHLLRNALVRDLKTTFRMRHLLRRSLLANPQSLLSAMESIWADVKGGATRSYSEIKFLEPPDDWYVEVNILPTTETRGQTVHFELLRGYLFVDRQPIGKLPSEYSNSLVLKELFGDQNLRTFPSSLPGMSFVLAITPFGQQVHLGFRSGKMVVRARFMNAILELVPRDTFGTPASSDLPAPLIEGCFHWLDILNGILEIRDASNIWRPNPNYNWLLNCHTNEATRAGMRLLDPQNRLFHRIARIFDGFEFSRYLTIVQPPGQRSLTVELRRLALTFSVNKRRILESPQLRAEIDPDQDAGTWYGLKSKLVLRDVMTTDRSSITLRQRSIIVPVSNEMVCERLGPHVSITLTNNGDYGKYIINNTLKRLDCPTEPRLLYLKAQLHAYTSFVIPDSLTGRTGAEEALHCLSSGYCQPWKPLSPGPCHSLSMIAKLTPLRQYYPPDRKVLQQVSWDKKLTTTIQDDSFRSIVEDIFAKSEQLSLFAAEKVDLPVLGPAPERHLSLRALLRRETYARANAVSSLRQPVFDLSYENRDRPSAGQDRRNLIQCATLLLKWPAALPTTSDLAGMLQQWSHIGSFESNFDKILLTDLIDLNFSTEWGSLVKLCSGVKLADRDRLLFLFATMSFSHGVNMTALQTLIAYSVLEKMKALKPPAWPGYSEFRHNETPLMSNLLILTEPSLAPYPPDERSLTDYSLAFRQRRRLEAAEKFYLQTQQIEVRSLMDFFLRQWPCEIPSIEGFLRPTPSLVNVALALELILPEWRRLFQNHQLSQYLSQVQAVLDQSHGNVQPLSHLSMIKPQTFEQTPRLSKTLPTLDDLIKVGMNPEPPTQFSEASADSTEHSLQAGQRASIAQVPAAQASIEIKELRAMVKNLMTSTSTVRQQYGLDLMLSLNALEGSESQPGSKQSSIVPGQLSSNISNAQTIVSHLFKGILDALEQQATGVGWLRKGGLLPCITPVTLLEKVRSTSTAMLGPGTKERIVAYGLAICVLQRLIRMEDAYHKFKKQRLDDEKLNVGHVNWNPLERPDWLLLEIDADILIRPRQVDVTLATISPKTQTNSVLQMNMGEGKTSCIMPMAAAVLADGKNLLRVVVPKALLLQTAQLLHGRLGGLVGRELRHVPFSRKTPTTHDTISTFETIHRDMQKSSGVMISLPEHLLSFMLSGLQALSDGRILESRMMVGIQNWMVREARDVLDESDYTLALRTQLIYPSGSQMTVDGHPHRWEVAETVLKMVDGHLWPLQNEVPYSIEVMRRENGGFPFIFFLRQDAEDALLARLVEDICSGRVEILPRESSKSDFLAIRQFISAAKVPSTASRVIRNIYSSNPAAKQVVLLLRGLFVHRLLLMTLKKRWNVQYGLHPDRDPIAVPYLAKGTPSEQSEWGHPDVAILFTCLSFYYDGLNTAQLRQSIEHVLKSDDPSQVYDRFSHDSTLPDSLRDWHAINVEDEAQLHEIWQHLRFNALAVDYFLNNFVFPKHAKQFHMKLQASGWDIPLFVPQKESSPLGGALKPKSSSSQSLTTGFSGTNDWKRMLPLNISQQDLPGLLHTNAEVLTYLLQGRNRTYVLATDRNTGRRFSEQELLYDISMRGIRVLIDAGAQIIEMDNFSLAKTWLQMAPNAPAVLYFDKTNRPMVLYQQGRNLPLLASPFADDLGECLVYLDEAHTRGIDLKMPPNAQGALTLGLGQTKDHTVQAAMRLRQLATTQSVVFFAPPEVHQSILDSRNQNSGYFIDSRDVIWWLLQQTCSGIEQLQPLYFSQGIDYCRRSQAALTNPEFLKDEGQREAYLGDLRQIEQQTLQQLYGLKSKTKATETLTSSSPSIGAFLEELNDLRKGFQDSSGAVHGTALQEVEQEREVAWEVQAVREIQKQLSAPLPHSPRSLHKDIERYLITGRLSADSDGYELALIALQRTTALGRKYGIHCEGSSGRLYVSQEFSRTVKFRANDSRTLDGFQRQVNWILWSTTTETALIVIPEEAEEIITILRTIEASRTHLLTYAAPVTRKMLHFGDLQYYAIPHLPENWQAPAWLKIELGIFAGRLYFEYDEYDQLCEYLGISHNVDKMEGPDNQAALAKGFGIDADGEDLVTTESQVSVVKTFTKTPLAFLQDWLAVRRKGQDFAHTPMGYVCQGKRLFEKHPFFLKHDEEAVPRKNHVHERSGWKTESGDKDEPEQEVAMFDMDEYGHDIGIEDDGEFYDCESQQGDGSD